MATSNVSICNLALARIGVREFIDSLDEDGTEAPVCKVFFEHCRDVVLQSFPWPFAQRRSTLALLEDVSRTNWEYAYALPSDFLVGRSITGTVRTPSQDARVAYAIEANDAGTGSILVSDETEVEFVYTARVTNPEMFPPLFVDALAWLLASELAVAIPNKADYRAQAVTRYEQQLTKATANSFGSGQDATPEAELITARL